MKLSIPIGNLVQSMFHRTNFVFWMASVVGIAGALIATLALYVLLETIERTTDARISLISLAGELRQSSDDLTRFARTFAATGDGEFRNRYQTVLDIREGRADRR
jgi:hypothetical protein